MNKVPVLNDDRIVAALQRDGWVVVRQRGRSYPPVKAPAG